MIYFRAQAKPKMNKKLILIAAIAVGCQEAKEPAEDQGLTYPETRKDSSVVDDYFGTRVADPYRWLEDDLSPETEAWVKAQNELTFGYLAKIPYRDAIKDRLTELWNYEKFSAPTVIGDFTYYYKNDGLQNHSVMYRENAAGEAEVFLDPNSFSVDGTTSLAGISFTKDGSLVAFQISEGGSDWRKVIIMDAVSKEVLEDTLTDVKFSGTSWKKNDGFYYSSYDKPKEGSELSGMTQIHKLFYHKLGTPQAEDKLVFGGEETPRRYVGGYVTEDQNFLVISAATSTTGNELYLQDLRKPGSAIINVINNFDNDHDVIHTIGEQVFIKTNMNAPNGKVVVTTVKALDPESWVDFIPETENVLRVGTAGGKFFANYLKDATSMIQQFGIDGAFEHEIELPGIGSAGGFGGRWDDEDIYYTFTSYVYPPTIFKYTIETGASEVYKESGVKFDPEQFESKQVFYTSKDGTKVPMILTYKKGVELNGNNPTMLYGYGGFNISLTPNFSLSNLVLMENGGVFAVANLRGGGEYGEKWHAAGTKMQKQNVFDDFIAAAEWLISNKYTSSEKLAIAGGSNGGLLVGATMTQRPELMKVAFPAVGVLDMLRYHKFTAGAGWTYDYGNSDENAEMFNYLHGYSPVHNTKSGTHYPATMITTADHDDRVVPSHSFKFASALQDAHEGANPVLIRIDVKAGHGAGKSTSMIIDEQSDKWAFMFWNMGVKELYGKGESH